MWRYLRVQSFLRGPSLAQSDKLESHGPSCLPKEGKRPPLESTNQLCLMKLNNSRFWKLTLQFCNAWLAACSHPRWLLYAKAKLLPRGFKQSQSDFLDERHPQWITTLFKEKTWHAWVPGLSRKQEVIKNTPENDLKLANIYPSTQRQNFKSKHTGIT